MKFKQGELEARAILENKGYVFDTNYWDNNSKDSMPDLKYKGGNYIEVTHTRHNHIKNDSYDVHSIINITYELTEDKGRKYKNRDFVVDLFCFITEQEYDDLEACLRGYPKNIKANRFLQAVYNSPFETIYLCIWNLYKKEYELENPILLTITKK